MNSRSLNKSLTTETCIHLTITTQPFRKSWTRLTSWHLFKFSSALLLQEAHMCFLLIYNEGGISFNKDRENSNEDKRNIFCSRISRNTGIFFKLRHHFSPSQLRQIYYNLFCPHLSYAIIAWNSPYKSNQKALRVKRVTRVQCSWIFTFTIFGNLSERFPFSTKWLPRITMRWC